MNEEESELRMIRFENKTEFWQGERFSEEDYSAIESIDLEKSLNVDEDVECLDWN